MTPFSLHLSPTGVRLGSFRSVDRLEQRAVELLRVGASVEVRYLRRPILFVGPARLQAIREGDRSTFLGTEITRLVADLGPNPAPGVWGKNRRAVLEILNIGMWASEEQTLMALERLRPYLK